MNATHWLFTLCVIWQAFFSPLSAQSDQSGVWDGVQAYQDGNYSQAITLLTNLLESPVAIQKSDLPAAHYFLGQSYLESALIKDLKEKYPQGLIRAFNHLMAAADLDTTGRFATLIKESHPLLSHELYQAGALAYNAQDYGRAVQFLDKVGHLQPGASDWQITRGYSFGQTADTLEAVDTWQRLVDQYLALELDPGAEEGVDRAFALIADMKRITGSPMMAVRAIRTGQVQFPDSDLLRQSEINLYRTYPGLLADETGTFKLSFDNQPKELPARVAYAGLLEEVGYNELSLEVYQGILIEDSLNYRANLSLAAYYINEAVSLKQEIESLNEPDSITHPLKQVMLFYLKNAYPHFQRLHKLKPEETTFVQRLWAISHYLDLPEATSYREKYDMMQETSKE